MGKVVVFGSFVVDLMARSPHLPVPGESCKRFDVQDGTGRKRVQPMCCGTQSGSRCCDGDETRKGQFCKCCN